MSSKLRLDDLSTDDLDEMTSDFLCQQQPSRQKKMGRKTRKREMIEDYIEQRSLKRQLTEPYDLY